MPELFKHESLAMFILGPEGMPRPRGRPRQAESSTTSGHAQTSTARLPNPNAKPVPITELLKMCKDPPNEGVVFGVCKGFNPDPTLPGTVDQVRFFNSNIGWSFNSVTMDEDPNRLEFLRIATVEPLSWAADEKVEPGHMIVDICGQLIRGMSVNSVIEQIAQALDKLPEGPSFSQQRIIDEAK